MSHSRHIALPPFLLPGSPPALAWLDRELGSVEPEDRVELEQAWMLGALPGRRALLEGLARAGRLVVGRGWVRPDPYALPGWRAPNDALAQEAAAALEGAQLGPAPPAGTDDAEGHAARAGLCLEQRALSDRLVARLPKVPALLPALLPATSPAGLGGRGDAGTEALAVALLRSACATAGLAAEPAFARPEGPELPRRVRQLVLESERLGVSWSRSRGMSWKLGDLRETFLPFSLEVQGDRGGRGAFAAGHPERPRVFEARHMHPVLYTSDGPEHFLHLEREVRLPEDPEAPKGRRAWGSWSLELRLDVGRSGLDVRVSIRDPAPGHRYRLWFPIPFHPRPSEIAIIEADGRVRSAEREGPFPPTPAMGPVAMRGKDHVVRVGGAGFREVELFARQNDWICAVTLLRSPAGEPAPARVVRLLSVAM